MKRDQRYFIGVDGGASKTDLILVDRDEHALAHHSAGPTNYRVVGERIAAQTIANGIKRMLRRRRLGPTAVQGMVCGLAAVDRPASVRLMRRELGRVLPPGLMRHTLITNDAHVGLAAGTGSLHGAMIIAGTGSHALAIDRRGREHHVGGMGELITDDGSAYHMVIHALRATAKGFDGRGPATKLEGLFCRRLGVQSFRDVSSRLRDAFFSKPLVAQLAPLVDRAAGRGDRVAQTILADMADELSLMVVTVIRRAGLTRTRCPLVLIGSVFNSTTINRRFRSSIRQQVPGIHFIRPVPPFAIGGARLAIQRFA